MTSRDLMDSLFLEDDDVEVFVTTGDISLHLNSVMVGEHPAHPGVRAIILSAVKNDTV